MSGNQSNTKQTVRTKIQSIKETANEASDRLMKIELSLMGPRPMETNALPSAKSPEEPSVELMLDTLHDTMKSICSRAASIGASVG